MFLPYAVLQWFIYLYNAQSVSILYFQKHKPIKLLIMGLFDSAEEKKQKENTKKTQERIAQSGISNLIDEKDLLKVIVEQNECLIRLATANAIANAGMVGDAVVSIHSAMYYNTVKQYFKENKSN